VGVLGEGRRDDLDLRLDGQSDEVERPAKVFLQHRAAWFVSPEHADIPVFLSETKGLELSGEGAFAGEAVRDRHLQHDIVTA
jgi:hypothetical protein